MVDIMDYVFPYVVERLDKTFGEGYAKANPELVGRIMQAEAIRYLGFVLSDLPQSIERINNDR